MRAPQGLTVTVVFVALAGACSSAEVREKRLPGGGSVAERQKTGCAIYVSLLTDCGLLTGSRLRGCEEDDAALPCINNCAANAGCDELHAALCAGEFNAFASCFEACDRARPAPEFVCADGTHIPASWRCDGGADCSHGEDEACPSGSFVCDNGLALPAGWQCDSVSDCPGGEDERDCGPRILCKDGKSLPESRSCDGVADCDGGEDERDCTWLNCQ